MEFDLDPESANYGETLFKLASGLAVFQVDDEAQAGT
jgi:hypothetical protein